MTIIIFHTCTYYIYTSKSYGTKILLIKHQKNIETRKTEARKIITRQKKRIIFTFQKSMMQKPIKNFQLSYLMSPLIVNPYKYHKNITKCHIRINLALCIHKDA